MILRLKVLLAGIALPFAHGSGGTTDAVLLNSFVLTGVVSVGSQVDVCLLDERGGGSTWWRVGSTQNGVAAVTYDAEKDAVLVRSGGASRWLVLREAKIRPLVVAHHDDGSVNWAHMNLTEAEKMREAELMMWDILEVGRLARAGKLPRRSGQPP